MQAGVAATDLRAAVHLRARRALRRAGLPVRRVHRHIDPRVLPAHRATGLRPLPALQVIVRQLHRVRRLRLRVPLTQP